MAKQRRRRRRRCRGWVGLVRPGFSATFARKAMTSFLGRYRRPSSFCHLDNQLALLLHFPLHNQSTMSGGFGNFLNKVKTGAQTAGAQAAAFAQVRGSGTERAMGGVGLIAGFVVDSAPLLLIASPLTHRRRARRAPSPARPTSCRAFRSPASRRRRPRFSRASWVSWSAERGAQLWASERRGPRCEHHASRAIRSAA